MRPATVCFLHFLAGVFAVASGTETLSVMLGDPVTLHTGVASVRTGDRVRWMFGPDSPDTLIAELVRWSYMLWVEVRASVQIDHQTGSLSIRSVGAQHAGHYRLTLSNRRNSSRRSFSLHVYAPLPVPVFSSGSNSSVSRRSSGRSCVLQCWAGNTTRATLSLYRGSDLLTSVSGGPELSLPLELEDGDHHEYSCEISNPFSHRSVPLNASTLCPAHTHTESSTLYFLFLLLLLPVALSVGGAVLCVCRRKPQEDEQTPGEIC